MPEVLIDHFSVGSGKPLFLIAGPCALESEALAMAVATRLKEITEAINLPFIFKSSYDKANRTSYRSFRGPGLKEGLRILKKIKEELKTPVLSDVHRIQEVGPASEVLDILQIPAFLCRQTDLISAVAQAGRVVNVKKGQFLSPHEMKYVIEKITAAGSKDILITERGASFGYHDLVADMRSLAVMSSFGYPVIFDCTHAVQSIGGGRGQSSGHRKFAPLLAQAAVATGKCDGIFMEVHPKPEEALSDGATMIPLGELPPLLENLKKISEVTR